MSTFVKSVHSALKRFKVQIQLDCHSNGCYYCDISKDDFIAIQATQYTYISAIDMTLSKSSPILFRLSLSF